MMHHSLQSLPHVTCGIVRMRRAATCAGTAAAPCSRSRGRALWNLQLHLRAYFDLLKLK